MYRIMVCMKKVEESSDFCEIIISFMRQAKSIQDFNELVKFIKTGIIEWESSSPVFMSGIFSKTRVFEFEHIRDICYVLGIVDGNSNLTGKKVVIDNQKIEDLFEASISMRYEEWVIYLKKVFS